MKYVWQLLAAIALIGMVLALLRTLFGQLVLAGLFGAFVGSLASVYGQLASHDRRR
jgi:hypothetical protein